MASTVRILSRPLLLLQISSSSSVKEFFTRWSFSLPNQFIKKGTFSFICQSIIFVMKMFFISILKFNSLVFLSLTAQSNIICFHNGQLLLVPNFLLRLFLCHFDCCPLPWLWFWLLPVWWPVSLPAYLLCLHIFCAWVCLVKTAY